MADNNVTLVQASYTDVNNALEGLIGNISSSGNANYASKTDLTNLQTTINNAGYATEKELNNLADSVPVGTIFAYSSNTIPSGYMLCNGASFDKTQLVDLYNALGSASVPDTRGLFLRGLDTTGGVDNFANRALLSFEEGSYLVNKENFDAGSTANMSSYSSWAAALQSVNNDLPANQSVSIKSAWASGGSETSGNPQTNYAFLGIARPKNIAVNYIIKAFKLATYGATSAISANGGTISGQITTSDGGVLPEVMGVSGRVVMQVFTVTVKDKVPVTFPTPFASAPINIQLTGVHDSQNTTNVPNVMTGTVTNTGFTITMMALYGGMGALADEREVYVTAIGTM